MTFSDVQTLMFQSRPLLGPGRRAVSRLATLRLDWKMLTALLAWYLEAILLCLMTPRGSRGASPCSLGSFLPCRLLFSVPFVYLLCTLCSCGHQTRVHCLTNRAIQRTTTALPDTGHPSPYSNEYRHFAIARAVADSESGVRNAILRYVAPWLVRRSHDGQDPRISSQALAAIIICATIVFCALVGALMQIPVLCPSCLRDRILRSGGSTSSAGSIPSSSSGSMPGFLDVEMGDQPGSLANGASPPPPYTRAPSYESSRSSLGRGDRTS